jgi:hypothetical protein
MNALFPFLILATAGLSPDPVAQPLQDQKEISNPRPHLQNVISKRGPAYPKPEMVISVLGAAKASPTAVSFYEHFNAKPGDSLDEHGLKIQHSAAGQVRFVQVLPGYKGRLPWKLTPNMAGAKKAIERRVGKKGKIRWTQFGFEALFGHQRVQVDIKRDARADEGAPIRGLTFALTKTPEEDLPRLVLKPSKLKPLLDGPPSHEDSLQFARRYSGSQIILAARGLELIYNGKKLWEGRFTGAYPGESIFKINPQKQKETEILLNLHLQGRLYAKTDGKRHVVFFDPTHREKGGYLEIHFNEEHLQKMTYRPDFLPASLRTLPEPHKVFPQKNPPASTTKHHAPALSPQEKLPWLKTSPGRRGKEERVTVSLAGSKSKTESVMRILFGLGMRQGDIEKNLPPLSGLKTIPKSRGEPGYDRTVQFRISTSNMWTCTSEGLTYSFSQDWRPGKSSLAVWVVCNKEMRKVLFTKNNVLVNDAAGNRVAQVRVQ